MIYTAPCIIFWMRAYPFRGEVGWGWAPEFKSFLGPVKWHRADRRVECHLHCKSDLIKKYLAEADSTHEVYQCNITGFFL
jgi:hypothetical protein